MPRSCPPYPPDSRQQIVELHRSGRSVAELVREFEPSQDTIRSWIRQGDADAGRRPDVATSFEKKVLAQLRPENRRLQKEPDILAKVAAWFAQETGSIPRLSS